MELLVVIGIIAILISLIFSASKRAVEVSRRTVCANNMRQITSAWLQYAADNGGAVVSSNTNVNAWVNSGSGVDAVKGGLLWKYAADTDVYRCPSDPQKNDYRTYSLNAFLNGEGKPGALYLRQIREPARTFLAIEEYDPRGYNVNSFMVPPTGDKWVDYPGTWHDWGTNISFCDGRVEYWRWNDQQTRNINSFYANTPNNPDLKRLQSVTLN